MNKKIYDLLRKYYRNWRKRKNLKGKYKFENRKKDLNKLCIIIAGYKPFLYDVVFSRIENFIPKDIDVCIVSSGKYDEILSKIAEKNSWSYLSTKRNCVSLVQNIAINLFTKAKYIYKLDEDIFVTENYFDTMFNTYIECEMNGDYNVGFVAPIIPINGYGNIKILNRFNMVEYYTKKFEKPLYATGRDRKVEYDPEVAKFMWGEGNLIPQLDEMNKIVQKDEFSYEACPIRFSIGAILFSREIWEKMKFFKVKRGSCMGLDEEQICSFCVNNSKAMIVSNNSIVGHLSFGNQNAIMKEYFIQNKEKFSL